MFHGVSNTLKGTFLESQLKELYEGSKRAKEDIAKAISDYSEIPLKEIEKLMIDGGVILTADQAKDKKLISDIIEPAIPSDTDIVSIGNN